MLKKQLLRSEKLFVTTTVFGYDRKRLQALKALGYIVGASLPGTVCPLLDKFITHHNVIRGIASGVFEDLYPWPLGGYQQRVDFGHVFPIVCEDELICEPVGTVDLSKDSAEVMQHSMSLGIVVRAEYQGLGVGTMLMDAVKTLAMRLHLARIWLGVFDGNTPAQNLYRKAGFEESGRVPGWLQEGYIDEIFMTLKLD